MLYDALSSLNEYCLCEDDTCIEEAVCYLAAFRAGCRSAIINSEVESIIEDISEKNRDIGTIIDRISIIYNSTNL